jgi:hypothetical protein
MPTELRLISPVLVSTGEEVFTPAYASTEPAAPVVVEKEKV